MTTEKIALQKAIDVAGGLTALGRLIGCTAQRVYNWQRAGRVPIRMCPIVEEVTGVPCEQLRPEVNWAYLRLKKGLKK